MSEVRYEAHPMIFRMRPLATLLVLAIMLAGFLLVGTGRYIPPATLGGLIPGLNADNLQFIGVVIFGLGAVRLYAWYVPTRFERFTITDEALIFTQGIMNKQRIEIRLAEVRRVQIDQTPWQRRLYIGDISVYAGGHDSPALVVRGLPCPEDIPALMPGQASAPTVA